MKKRRPMEDRFWEKVVRLGNDECWGWNGSTSTWGYGKISAGGRGGKLKDAHRVSWAIHNGPIPSGLWVLHTCDNPPCTNPRHLFLGTPLDNVRDMRAKGRGMSGDAHTARTNSTYLERGDQHWSHRDPGKVRRGVAMWNARFVDADIASIRLRAKKEPAQKIAKDYGVCRATIENIAKRRTWRHVP
jgi:hypothetical protein